MTNKTQCSPFKIGSFRQIVPSFFHQMIQRPRAQRGTCFNIYLIFLWIAYEKGRAQRGNVFNFEMILLNFA